MLSGFDHWGTWTCIHGDCLSATWCPDFGTLAWLVELVEMAGTRDDHPFVTRIMRLTVFERRDGRWRRVANATSEAP